MERVGDCSENDLNFKATELRLGLPGSEDQPHGHPISTSNKRPSAQIASSDAAGNDLQPPFKAQVVGWPPIRSYRKNCLVGKKSEGESGYVKVSMDGVPYLRKIDLRVYKSYIELVKALENMFKFSIGSDYAPTYQDRDEDWMLVGDVPWDMFISTCKRLRIMKGSEARGLACS